MTLHMVSAHITTATGAGTEDTLTSTAFSPTGEIEVQGRTQLGAPKLIGYTFQDGDVAGAQTTTGGLYGRLGLNTWPTAMYIKHPPNLYGVATGGVDGTAGASPINWIQPGIDLDADADWDLRLMTTTANTWWTTLLFLQYGAAIPWNGWPTTWRLVSASADVTANTWSSIGSITDLDPRLSYRVNVIAGETEDQPLSAIRVTSASNSTYAGGPTNQIIASANNQTPWLVTLPYDSIIVSGVETVVVQGLADAATKPSAFIGFQPIGQASAQGPKTAGAVAAATPGLSFGGGRSVAPANGAGRGIFGIGR